MAQRQLALAYGFGGVPQRFGYVLNDQVGQVVDDLCCGHAVSDHRDDGGHGDAKAADRGCAAHHVRVDRDSLVGHVLRVPSAGRLSGWRRVGGSAVRCKAFGIGHSVRALVRVSCRW